MKQYYLGTDNVQYFIALFFFACLGAIISLLIQSNMRDVKSQSTPVKFSWSFFFLDNWKRIVFSLLIIYVAIRFSSELLHVTLGPFSALGIGLGLDKVSELIKNNTGFLQVNRDKIS